MEQKHNFIEGIDRYYFDDALIPQGYHQLDSEHDAWYYGHWFNPATLRLVSYAEGDVTSIAFDNGDEFVQWATDRRDLLGLLHIDDWSQNWAPAIEKTELEIYLSYLRNDMIQ